MPSVIRFDLLNMHLTEPVEVVDFECPTYPEFKRIVFCPLQWSEFSLHHHSDVVAFLELKDPPTQDELALQRRAQEFMIWICWLLSLAQRHDVYYWGSHHFGGDPPNWKWHSSAWKATLLKDWKPRLKDVFEGNVLDWRLPDFLSTGLRQFSDPAFRLKDFFGALHMFLDSLPIDQLSETRFIKKWIAFEKLANEQARTDGYLYVFGKAKSKEFAGLRERLNEAIKHDPSVTAQPHTALPFQSHLAALERLPVKMLSRRFLDELKIKYDPATLKKIVDTRNDIFHYLDAGIDPQEMWNLDQTLVDLLSTILCRKLGWHRDKEFDMPYVQTYRDPLPDYVNLRSESFENKADGSGWLEVDGKHLLDCRGKLEWTRDRISGEFAAKDPLLTVLRMNTDRYFEIRLRSEKGNDLLLEKGKIDHRQGTIGTQSTNNNQVTFGVVGLRLFETVRPLWDPPPNCA